MDQPTDPRNHSKALWRSLSPQSYLAGHARAGVELSTTYAPGSRAKGRTSASMDTESVDKDKKTPKSIGLLSFLWMKLGSVCGPTVSGLGRRVATPPRFNIRSIGRIYPLLVASRSVRSIFAHSPGPFVRTRSFSSSEIYSAICRGMSFLSGIACRSIAATKFKCSCNNIRGSPSNIFRRMLRISIRWNIYGAFSRRMAWQTSARNM
jgi:hypothetical protein